MAVHNLNTTVTTSMATDIIWILEKELVKVEKKYESVSKTDPWYVREAGHIQSMINKLLEAQELPIKY